MLKKPSKGRWPFVIGDVVEMRSGSPDLLVLEVDGGWVGLDREFCAAVTVAWRSPETGAIHESVQPAFALRCVRPTEE